ncbi:MAG TPA: thioredoxin domain-containing protein [Conexibacter sp.]|jgi:protein-disulfide isomerase
MTSNHLAPDGATPEGDGIVLGTGPVRIDAYIDFMCPYCRRFEARSGPTLDRLVAEGKVTLVYHPVGFLNRFSQGTRYSTRAVAAAGCASDAGSFAAFKDALFAKQPDENTAGLSDEQMIALGAEAGVGGGFADCVRAGAHLPWADSATDAAAVKGITGIPTVFVNGRHVEPNPYRIADAVAGAQ